MAGVSWRAGEGHVYTLHALMNARTQRQTQTPTLAVPSAKPSGVFVQCFIADTFSTPWCLYSISCCPCSRKELKQFVSLMQRRQSVQFTLISLYLSGSGGERERYVSCTLLRCDHEQGESGKTVVTAGVVHSLCFVLVVFFPVII